MSELWSAFYKRFNGKVEIHCFGKQAGDLDEYEISAIAHRLEVNTVLWPETHTFNAKICEPTELGQRKKIGRVTIRRGCLADGVVIPLGQAACLRSADCPTIVARHDFTTEVIAAHAGRESLIDEGRWKFAHPSRKDESIVDAVCRRLIRVGKRTRDIEIFSCCGVGANHFRHPTALGREHSLHNFLRNRYIVANYGSDCFLGNDTDDGALDLHRLIARQCESYRLPPDNIHHDAIDTARDREKFFSRRGGDPTGHNTILVIRRG